MLKTLIIIAIGFGVYKYLGDNPQILESFSDQSPTEYAFSDDDALTYAYNKRLSDVQVRGEGRVIAILADDNDGSRHQKFILERSSGQTLLVAHNIDLSRRINLLRKGDNIEFYGEYEWNSKGGVIHWTHHDPRGRHMDGWLKHKGSKYD